MTSRQNSPGGSRKKIREGSEPYFVIFRGYTFLKVDERDILPTLFHYRSGDGDLDSEEEVSLSILSFPCLEKTRQAIYQRRVGGLHHSGLQNIYLTFRYGQFKSGIYYGKMAYIPVYFSRLVQTLLVYRSTLTLCPEGRLMPKMAPAEVAQIVSGRNEWSFSMSRTLAVKSPRIPPPSSTSPSLDLPLISKSLFTCSPIRESIYFVILYNPTRITHCHRAKAIVLTYPVPGGIESFQKKRASCVIFPLRIYSYKMELQKKYNILYIICNPAKHPQNYHFLFLRVFDY